MGCRVLDYEPFVSLNALKNSRLLDGPFANKGPVLVSLWVFLLCVGRLPSVGPVISELFDEWRLDIRGLRWWVSSCTRLGEDQNSSSYSSLLTVKVGFSMTELVAESTASVADDTISSAPEDADETTSSTSAYTCPKRRADP